MARAAWPVHWTTWPTSTHFTATLANQRRHDNTTLSKPCFFLVGDYAARVTPVPIPNTVVKPRRADGTARAIEWESTTSPAFDDEKARPEHTLGAGFFHRGRGARERERATQPGAGARIPVTGPARTGTRDRARTRVRCPLPRSRPRPRQASPRTASVRKTRMLAARGTRHSFHVLILEPTGRCSAALAVRC